MLGTTRALFLLFALPCASFPPEIFLPRVPSNSTVIISTFKPKPKLPKGQVAAANKAAKPKPTKSHIAREIKFDLGLSRLSLCIDIVANLSVVFAPAPSYKMHSQALNGLDSTVAMGSEFQNSQALFVVASWMQCMGAGVVPAIQSLALCIIQARSLLAADAGQPGLAVDTGTGTLFGALAVLQAGGQMVLGVCSHFLYSRHLLIFLSCSLCCSVWCTVGPSRRSPKPYSSRRSAFYSLL
jgi:hypothetical protein